MASYSTGIVVTARGNFSPDSVFRRSTAILYGRRDKLSPDQAAKRIAEYKLKKDGVELRLNSASCREIAVYEGTYTNEINGLLPDNLDARFYINWTIPRGGKSHLIENDFSERVLNTVIGRLKKRGHSAVEYRIDTNKNTIKLYFPINPICGAISSFFGLLIKFQYEKFHFLKSGEINLLRTFNSSPSVRGVGIIQPGLFSSMRYKDIIENFSLNRISGVHSLMADLMYSRNKGIDKLVKGYITRYGLQTKAYEELGNSYLKELGIERKSTIKW